MGVGGLHGCFSSGDRQFVSSSVLKGFTDDALIISRQIIPKRDSAKAESVMATADVPSLLMELKDVAA